MPHRTDRNLSRKEQGLSMLTESLVPTAIVTLRCSFVLSDLLLNLIDCKLKKAINNAEKRQLRKIKVCHKKQHTTERLANTCTALFIAKPLPHI